MSITAVTRERLADYADFECGSILAEDKDLMIDERFVAKLQSPDDRDFWIEVIDLDGDEEDLVSLQCVGTFPGNRDAAAYKAVHEFILPALEQHQA